MWYCKSYQLNPLPRLKEKQKQNQKRKKKKEKKKKRGWEEGSTHLFQSLQVVMVTVALQLNTHLYTEAF